MYSTNFRNFMDAQTEPQMYVRYCSYQTVFYMIFLLEKHIRQKNHSNIFHRKCTNASEFICSVFST